MEMFGKIHSTPKPLRSTKGKLSGNCIYPEQPPTTTAHALLPSLNPGPIFRTCFCNRHLLVYLPYFAHPRLEYIASFQTHLNIRYIDGNVVFACKLSLFPNTDGWLRLITGTLEVYNIATRMDHFEIARRGQRIFLQRTRPLCVCTWHEACP